MKARALTIISSYMYMKKEKFGFHIASEDLNILWSSKFQEYFCDKKQFVN